MQALTDMKSIRRHAMTLTSVAAIFLLAACSEDPLDPTAGAADATIEVTATELGHDVARILITVDADDLAGPISRALPADDDDSAEGSIQAPAGLDRTLTVRSYDGDGQLLRMGQTTIDLQPGEQRQLRMALEPLSTAGGGDGGGVEIGQR